MSMTGLDILSRLNNYTDKRAFIAWTADLAHFSIRALAQVSVASI